jgi:pimeloyl-ACP methyl ester carboxylesterase
MPFSSPNETVLHYERSGAGEALVLVHGSWVDGNTWDTVRPGLARSFEVVAFDRQGHSRSYIEALEAFATGVVYG